MPAATAVAEVMLQLSRLMAWVAPYFAISAFTMDMGTWLMFTMPLCRWLPTTPL